MGCELWLMSRVSVSYFGGGDDEKVPFSGFLSMSASHTSPWLEKEPERCVYVYVNVCKYGH